MNLDDRQAIGNVRRSLRKFFDLHGRDLPWRRERTPYRVLISEIMLQQTRAEVVRVRYGHWLQRFPGWRELAAASLDEVLLEWKGLGYYARARNLHRTAHIVCAHHGGELPAEVKALRALPGVGEYTAGAVASIAFGKAVPAVDGNVRRVLCRLLDLPNPGASVLRAAATRLLDPPRPGHHNEAMIELGATVCTPRAPRCPRCPVRPHCAAHHLGTTLERPLPQPRKLPRRVEFAVAVAINEAGQLLVVRRPTEGLLGGMWEFPAAEFTCPLPGPDRDFRTIEEAPNKNTEAHFQKSHNFKSDHQLHDSLLILTDQVHNPGDPIIPALERLAELGLQGIVHAVLAPIGHLFTHLRARYHPVVIQTATSATPASPDEAPTAPLPALRWVAPADIDSLALPVAQQKIAAAVRSGS